MRGAAELHPPSADGELPEIAFSVEDFLRRRGVGSLLFKRLIAEARWKGYRSLRVTTGAQNQAMRALASKFGAHLVFHQGESTGTIDRCPSRGTISPSWSSTRRSPQPASCSTSTAPAGKR